MRRLLICLSAVFMSFALLGCSGEVVPVTKGFKCVATVKNADNFCEFLTEVKSDGGVSFTVQKPTGLKGMKYVFNGKCFSVAFLGTESEITKTQNNFVYLYKSVIDELNQNRTTRNNSVFKGTNKNGSYTVSFRPDGFIKSMVFHSLGITAEFKSYEYLF